MKTRLLIIIGIVFFSTLTNEAYAICAAEELEWWEPCNDEGQNDVLSFKAMLMITISTITGITIVFFIWRKRK